MLRCCLIPSSEFRVPRWRVPACHATSCPNATVFETLGEGPEGHREEVAGPERREVTPDELVPGALTALGTGVEMVPLEDVFDRVVAEAVDVDLPRVRRG